MKIFRYIPVLIFVLWGGFANAQSIFEVPSPVPSETKGGAWEHPLATVEGVGELKFRDSVAGIDLNYKGNIICDVYASAPMHIDNALEFSAGPDGTDLQAKTLIGTLQITNCSVDNYPIPSFPDLTANMVKVEIEGFVQWMVNGAYPFSEYGAERKAGSGRDPKLKLELENGTITLILPETPPCGSEFCPPGGGGGGVPGGPM